MFGAARWPVGEDFHVGLAGRQPGFGLETHVELACRRPTRGAANEQQWHQQQNPMGHTAMASSTRAGYFSADSVGPEAPRGSRLGPDGENRLAVLTLGSTSTPTKQFCISSQF